jgi:VanZ family protein
MSLSRQFIIPFAWTIVIGVLCGLPGNTFPDLSFWKFLQFDSAAHAFVFLCYTFLWGVGFSKQRHSDFLRRNAIIIAATSGVLYGILIEILQYYIFIGRSCEFSDMVSDAVGCGIGFLVFRGVYVRVQVSKL